MFRIDFETCNAAFGSDEVERRAEVVRILRKIIRMVESDFATEEGVVLDANGNKIGDWRTDRGCRCLPGEGR
jgi:hypothetical protein